MNSDEGQFNQAVDLVMEAEKFKANYQLDKSMLLYTNALQLMTTVAKNAKASGNAKLFNNAKDHADEFLRRVHILLGKSC